MIFSYSFEITFDEFLAALCAVEAINTIRVDRTSLAIGISAATAHVPSYDGDGGRKKIKPSISFISRDSVGDSR